MQDIEKFIRGFSRFQQQYLAEPSRFESLREGQHPGTLVIGCCDSRVDPALLTGSDPGELFVVRNIANLVPPCTPDAPPGVTSAIEFAVCGLEVARIIVLGHARCGGIRALMSPRRIAAETNFVERWMRIAEPVRERVLRELPHKDDPKQHKACELGSILHSLDNLMTYPWIKQRVEEGRLILHGWYFDITTGALLAYSPRKQEFLPLVSSLQEGQPAAA
ncbi:MAG TPA: carbonic anhydrase [Noviherbaspirillum sp.]|uniref:carbonic anhydrase n=1 Tax=Noviherbaspirillum sp. TaxID=1926288 RepID=UPI002D7225E7|nr:carbonic anhydrase [Noviherbaspirillum sp.]HYD95809.1 carbonic anhydrase [Noviherbaspirillum sp.]